MLHRIPRRPRSRRDDARVARLLHVDGGPDVAELGAGRLDHGGVAAEAGEAERRVLAREGVGVVLAHCCLCPPSLSSFGKGVFFGALVGWRSPPVVVELLQGGVLLTFVGGFGTELNCGEGVLLWCWWLGYRLAGTRFFKSLLKIQAWSDRWGSLWGQRRLGMPR